MSIFDLRVALVGAFQNGKSTLVNCLLGGLYSRMGYGVKTTPCCYSFIYGETEAAKLIHRVDGGGAKIRPILREELLSPRFSCPAGDRVEIACPSSLLERSICLIDTPGFNADARDDAAAAEEINSADLVIFVTDARKTLTPHEKEKILKKIGRSGKKMIFLLNCNNIDCGLINNWLPSADHNQEIAADIESDLCELGLGDLSIRIRERLVWPCNPIFAWYASGLLQRDLENPHPGVYDAADRIEQIRFFCDKQKWPADEPKRKELLLRASGIIELRQAIEDNASVRHEYDSLAKEFAALLRRLSSKTADIITEMGRSK